MRVSSPEAAPMAIGRMCGPQSSVFVASSPAPTQPSTRSKTIPASATAGRSQPKSREALAARRRGLGAAPQDLSATARWSLIPATLSDDRCEFACRDRRDADSVGDEPIPRVAASLDDVVVTLPDSSAELVAAEILTDVLDRIELGCVGRQAKQGDVPGDGQSLSRLMPAGSGADPHRML